MKGHYYKRDCTCETENCGCTWTFVIDIGKDPLSRERRQKSQGGFRTRLDAEIAAADLLNKINKGTYTKESDILFKDFANEWLPTYIARKAPKPGTIRIREYCINKLLDYFAQVKLKEITKEMYQAALDDLKDRDFAENTIEGIHTTGKMIFKTAISERIIRLDATDDTYIKRDPQTIIEFDEEELPNYFEKEELVLFLATVKEKGLYMDLLIFLTLAYTGMRVGELVALKWKDINFEKQMISVTKTYYNPDNNTIKYELLPPKTKKSRRKIVVDELVINAFRQHKEEQEKLIERFGSSYYNEGYVFSNFNSHPGYPILIKLVESRMARLLKKVNLNLEVTPHSLRHTHTSLLAEAGVGLEEIMDRLGHQDDEVTRSVYLHVTSEMKKEASNKFSKLMRSIS